MTGSKELGKVKVFEEIEPAVSEAWLVIEAVPEQLDLKISIFALLEKSAPHDALLASNSSSYKSSEIVVQVSDSGKERAFNMHYYRPPENMIVELMTDGVTRPEILTFMSERLKKTGALPFVARKESTGFIFNRLWAAVKREVLMIISEGIGSPQEIDSYWNEAFIKPKVGPCKAMDEAGLDTIAFIESHYIAERGLETSHLDFLKAEYLEKGKLGDKSAAGGLCTT
jgi:3-hydroxyacyl-CoA dehydrogenase